MKERPDALIVLSKFPRRESAKTRLATAIGSENAQKIAEAFLIDLVERFCTSKKLRLIIAGSQNDTVSEFKNLLQEYKTGNNVEIIIPKSGSMEGDIRASYKYALQKSKAAILTASDIPYLSRRMVSQMLTDLKTNALVFHPNTDGNACPHGMKKSIDLFTGTPSRSASYMTEWIARIRTLRLKYKVLSMLFDIDRIEDLKVFYNWQILLKNSGKMENLCPRTMKLLDEISPLLLREQIP